MLGSVFTKDKTPKTLVYNKKKKGTDCREGLPVAMQHPPLHPREARGERKLLKGKQQACKAVEELAVLPDKCLPHRPSDRSVKVYTDTGKD